MTTPTPTPSDPLGSLARLAPRAGVLLDFDGTLSPIVARPELAYIVEGATDVLGSLVERYAVVAIVSGRPSAEVGALVGVAGVRYEGLYGLTEAPGRDDLAARVEAAAAEVSGAWVERKGATVAVHFRLAAEPDVAERELRKRLAPVAADAGLELLAGKRVLELVPAGRPLKDGAVRRIVEESAVEGVLYAGDDVADLRAFAVLDELAARGLVAVKVAVRGAETPSELVGTADLVVEGPVGLLGCLRRL